MRPAEIGDRRILPNLDNAAPNSACTREVREQGFAVAAANGAGQLRKVFIEGAQHLQHRVLVGEEDIAPHGWIGCGDASEIAETAGGEFEHFRACHFGEFVGGADDGVGNQVRQVNS